MSWARTISRTSRRGGWPFDSLRAASSPRRGTRGDRGAPQARFSDEAVVLGSGAAPDLGIISLDGSMACRLSRGMSGVRITTIAESELDRSGYTSGRVGTVASTPSL
jgi:hypothetical protein